MFVLYAYECPILSGYTMQQSTNILPLDSENNQFAFGIRLILGIWEIISAFFQSSFQNGSPFDRFLYNSFA